MMEQHEHYNYSRLNDLNIVEVARRLNLPLRRAGVNMKTRCLWHSDQHPSLVLYKTYCHCYACGAHHSVIDLAMQAGGWTLAEACQWLSQQFGIDTLSTWRYVPPQHPQAVPQPQEPNYRYIPMAMVDAMVSADSSLCRCLMHMAYHDHALWTPEAVKWQVGEYRLGNHALWDYDDYTVFPSIDYYGRVCNLKAQHYDSDPASARFGHDDKGQSYWLGKMWLKDGTLTFNDRPKATDVCFRNDCLFGEHLLKCYPRTTVALVESPKNALFGALAFPELLWVAAGNKHNLNRRVLECLRGRDVMAFPDCDAIPLWTNTLKGMMDLANFTVSDLCQQVAPDDQPKFDIADYLQMEIMGK